MTFVPNREDREGLISLAVRAIEHQGPVEVKCLSHDEAMWIRQGLEALGIPHDKLRMSWLEFHPPSEGSKT